jgi:creatinine amidohydrolase
MHAGEIETSILLHAHPELVRDGYQAADWVADDRRYLLTTGMGEYTRSGVIGRPSLGAAEKGKAVLASLVEASHQFWRSCGGDSPTWRFT